MSCPACPACNSQLAKPDDAVIANLNPSEDYKTSILSGLSPNVIMECAGRALSFWAYQTTQQISYQQYLCKTLAEKYSNLKLRLDQTAKDANIELERLRQKLDCPFPPAARFRHPLLTGRSLGGRAR